MSRNRKNTNDNSKLIVLGLFLLFTMPGLIIPIAVLGLFIYVLVRVFKATNKTHASQSFPVQETNQTYSAKKPAQIYTAQKQEPFDDCPSSFFCFHKDKGMHHVRRGKEQDPWDRPDIDISKYQRRE